MAMVVGENKNDLQKYLFNLRDLEASRYKQRQYIAYLTAQLKQANNPRLNRTNTLHEYDDERSWFSIILWALGFGAVGVGAGFVYEVVYWVYHLLFHKNPLALGVGALWGAIIAAIGGLLVGLARYLMDHWSVNRKNQEINEKNDRIKQRNQSTIDSSRKKAALLKTELDRAMKALNATEEVRARYYAMDVIYPKYRALIPITMFCEYFESGRCSELAGANGAYNIYENESRLDQIVVKLDDIINRLDQIRESQMMLADLLAECNRELRGLNQTVSKQVETLSQIGDKIEVSNYYSRITACNTTCLTWLAVLERR